MAATPTLMEEGTPTGRRAKRRPPRHALRTIDHHAQVELGIDCSGFIDQDFAHLEAFDLHAQNLVGYRLGIVGRFGQFDAACLTAATNQDLGFDDHARVEPACDVARRRGRCGNLPTRDRHAIFGKNTFGLILLQVQVATPLLFDARSVVGRHR